MTYVIGISAYYHDSACALIKNGEIISAVQEERFTRKKHDSSFPLNSIKWILKENCISIKDIKYIVFYEKPFLKFERIIESYMALSPFGIRSFLHFIPEWITKKIFLKELILKELKKLQNLKSLNEKIFFSEHHMSHAASAFYPSPFKSSAILTLDGVGEWDTSTISIGKENHIHIKNKICYPHSIGLLYSAFTYYLGFKVNEDEYKVMGLAPYGKPIFKDLIINELISLKDDGSFKMNLKYFDYATGFTMTNKKFSKLFGKDVRDKNDKINQFHMNIASSIQKVIELIIIKISKYIKIEFKEDNLCLAGGVALNCVANGVIKKEKIFKNIWIQPASGDSGGAIGAALSFYYQHLNKERVVNKNDSMKRSYLGPSFKNEDIANYFEINNINYQKYDNRKLIQIVYEYIDKGNIIGWFQGKMEFGPRALGNRSIIADARKENMQKRLNLKTKFRESFRPFAPIVLEDQVNKWFEFEGKSPYMLFVANVKKEKLLKTGNDIIGLNKIDQKRSLIPSVTHVDNSARLQTVTPDNGRIYDLLKYFFKKTNCPILINTSFNLSGEPIVCDFKDAYKSFMVSDLDYLVCENIIISKN